MATKPVKSRARGVFRGLITFLFRAWSRDSEDPVNLWRARIGNQVARGKIFIVSLWIRKGKFILNSNFVVKRFYSLTEVSVYLGVSTITAQKFCDQIGAKTKIGKRNLYDIYKIDQYFDQQPTIEEGQVTTES